MSYRLTRPMIVTHRKLPGVRLGAATLSISEWRASSDVERFQYTAYLDVPLRYAGKLDERTNVAQNNPGGPTAGERARDRIHALLSFLVDDARRFDNGETPRDGWTFDRDTARWASANLDVIEGVVSELEHYATA